MHIVDGMHRCVAIRDVQVRDAMEKNGYRVKAYLYFRQDGAPMRETDDVSIGGAPNSQDSLSIRMSNGDRCHNSNATFMTLMKLEKEQFPKSTKRTYNKALLHLAEKKHMIERTPFRIIMDEHNMNSDITNRKQRAKYEKFQRGVFRYSTTAERAELL